VGATLEKVIEDDLELATADGRVFSTIVGGRIRRTSPLPVPHPVPIVVVVIPPEVTVVPVVAAVLFHLET
jgi:hypothetical protein